MPMKRRMLTAVSIPKALAGVAVGEIVEQYPDDKPFPSCLIYSEYEGPLHSVWAYIMQ